MGGGERRAWNGTRGNNEHTERERERVGGRGGEYGTHLPSISGERNASRTTEKKITVQRKRPAKVQDHTKSGVMPG